jgi:hypothetical protein
VAKTLTCKCGQTVDIETQAPGAAVRCPGCQNSLTVPSAAAPQMAMAAAIDDSEPDLPPTAAKRKLSPAEEQKLQERLAARRSQRALMKIMLWPAAIFGLACLGIAGVGVLWWAHPADKTVEIKAGADGLDHLYALDPTPNAPPHQFIEVQPDIIPGDSAKRDDDDNLVYQLNGQPVKSQGGSRWVVALLEKGGATRQATIERHGLWFYEIDPATGKILHKLDKLPLMAEERNENADYVPVEIPLVTGNSVVFNKRGSDPPAAVDVVYYRVEGAMQTDKLGKFKEPETGVFISLRENPWIFIAAGLAIALMLLGAAGFFAQQCYFSKEAKAAKARAA